METDSASKKLDNFPYQVELAITFSAVNFLLRSEADGQSKCMKTRCFGRNLHRHPYGNGFPQSPCIRIAFYVFDKPCYDRNS
jgi:hypothetical protein